MEGGHQPPRRAPAALTIAALGLLAAAEASAAVVGDVAPYRARDDRVDAADVRVALAAALGGLPLPSNDATLADVAPGTLGGGSPPAFTPGGDGAVTAGDAVVIAGAAARILALPSDAVDFPITIRIDGPTDGTFVLQSRPPIDLRYAAAAGVDTATLAFTANAEAIATTCALSPAPTTTGSGTCTPDLALSQGVVALVARAEDTLGNAATDVVTVDVDSIPVSVAITEPTDGLITTDDEVAVAGTVGADVERVEVAGIEAAMNGASFTATVPLREGTQMITAVAVKTNGNTGSAAVEATRDLFAPIVRITSPADGFVSANPTVTVTGLANDIVAAGGAPAVLVNGVAADVAAGAFVAVDLPLRRGPNRIEAIARDAAGNEGTDAIDVTYAPPAGPRISILGGNGQTAEMGALAPEPLAVVVQDAAGNPVAARRVRFEVTRNDGLLAAEGATPSVRALEIATDGAGRAAASFRLGTRAGAGANRVRALAAGIAGEVELCLTGTTGAPARILMVGGDNQRGAAGYPVPVPLEALVIDAEGNAVPGTDVTFRIERGDGNLGGLQSLARTTGPDGVARAMLRLGFGEAVGGNVVSASFAGLASGGEATFMATGLAPGDPADTRFAGVVLDNAQVPIPGATADIPGAPLPATTDADGRFEIAGVPVGPIHLHIDPTTSPRPELFPPLAFEVVTVAGRVNTVGMPILIPALNPTNARMVGGDEDVSLTMAEVQGLEIVVAANSVTFPDGSRTGLLSIDQVHLDKVPMPPPSGTIFMPPAWTLQPAGVRFDPPALVIIPNDALPPGRVIDIFQFDHDLFRFINVGQATVTEDARLIVTDTGFGITRTGWGGCGQPQPPTTCASSCDDGNPCTRDYCQTGFCFHIFDVQVDAGAPGDCKKIFCEDGELMEVDDDTDVPRQTSNTDCVRQTCQNGAPATEPDDSETPPQSSPNDCFREICSGGMVALEPDDSEEPSIAEDTDLYDCMRLACEFGSKVLRPAPDKESPMQASDTDCMAQIFDPDCNIVNIPNDNEFPPDGPGPDGDCKVVICLNGARAEIDWEEPLPQDSGSDCVANACVNGVPTTIPFPQEDPQACGL